MPALFPIPLDTVLRETGGLAAGAQVRVLEIDGTDEVPTYATPDGDTPVPQPIVADETGRIPPHWTAAGEWRLLITGYGADRTIPITLGVADKLSPELSGSVASADVLLANAVSEGADRTGSADATAAINAALAKGSAFLPDGTYRVNGTVQVPLDRDLTGAGPGRTRLVLGPGGSVRHGTRGTETLLHWGGTTAGFTIDGQESATSGLYVGLCANRRFADIEVTGVDGEALLIECGQNNLFVGCTFWRSKIAVALDYGAGGNVFDRCEIALGRAWLLVFRQSGPQPEIAGVPVGYGAPYGPSFNVLRDSYVEYLGVASAIPDGPEPTEGLILHEAGYRNTFERSAMSQGNAAEESIPCIRVEQGNPDYMSRELIVIDSWIFGTTGKSTAIETDGNTTVMLQGRNVIQGHDAAFATRSSDRVTVAGDPAYIGVDQVWEQVAGDSPTTALEAVVQDRRQHMQSVVLPDPASDSHGVIVDGDTSWRTLLGPGRLVLGDGTAYPTAVLYAMAHWLVSNSLALTGDLAVNGTATIAGQDVTAALAGKVDKLGSASTTRLYATDAAGAQVARVLTGSVAASSVPYRDTSGRLKAAAASASDDLVQLSQVDQRQAGQVAAPPFSYAANLTVTANNLRLTRLPVTRTMTAKFIAFAVTTAATSDDPVEVGIYDSSWSRLATSGPLTGYLNGTTGGSGATKKVPIPDTTLVAGSVYYLALVIPAVGGTPASVVVAHTSVAGAANLFGSSSNPAPPTAETALFSVGTLPASLSGATGTAAGFLLAARES